MNTLRRHQLVCLNALGWRQVRAQVQAQADQIQECLAHWANDNLPLVVSRQTRGVPDGTLVLGLAAPARWGRRRLTLHVDRKGIAYFDAFPLASAIHRLLPVRSRSAWLSLCRALNQAGSPARVYGSHGWQHLTGLGYLQPTSDMDLLLPVASPEQADQVVTLLFGHEQASRAPRLDGELVFGNGAAVAWREWAVWRAGQVQSLLVKRLQGVELTDMPFWAQREPLPEVCA